MQQDIIHGIGATRLVIGLSTLVKVSPMMFQNGSIIKILSGAGTLEIIPFPVTLGGASAAGWGTGYPIGNAEVLSVQGPAQFYLAATGATITAAYAPTYSAGVTFTV